MGQRFSRRCLHGLILLAGLLWLGCAGAADAAAPAARRIALVIGNGNYAEHPLKNAVNDARLIAATLVGVGFEVIQGADLTQRQMVRLIDDFRTRAQAADVALIYYAGHGMQVGGSNYLIPVDLVPRDEFDVTSRSVNLDRIADMVKTERGRVNLIVVDACRDNPFGASRSLASRGLAEIRSRPGTLIAYSTAPGSIATDSAAPGGRNSIYSWALSNAIAAPGVPVEEAFKDVRREVLRVTQGRQTPWETTSLTVPFSFNPDGKTVPGAAARAAALSAPARAAPARSMPSDADDAAFYLPPEEARRQLAGMGVAWTNDAFADSLAQGDAITAALFIRGGKKVTGMARNQALLAYLACGEGRAATVRMLRKQGVDLNQAYDRRYRIEGVWITAQSHILHTWLSTCPANDIAFARELVEAGVKWPAEVRLDHDRREDWARGALQSREAVKILVRGHALDPAVDDDRIYRAAMVPGAAQARSDTEFMALIAPADRKAGARKSAAPAAPAADAQAQTLIDLDDSTACTFGDPHSMAPLSDCVAQRRKAAQAQGR